jgi:hypothetical protein
MKLPIQVSSSRSRIERLSMTVLPQQPYLGPAKPTRPTRGGSVPWCGSVQTPPEACATDWPIPFDPTPDPQPLILCPRCKLEMRLLGIEPYNSGLELFTFECTRCGHLEVRTVPSL